MDIYFCGCEPGRGEACSDCPDGAERNVKELVEDVLDLSVRDYLTFRALMDDILAD